MKVKTVVTLLSLAPLLVSAAGCHLFRHFTYACHKKQPYLQASSVAPLKIPEGMDAPDTSNALRLPTLNQPAPAVRHGQQPCLDEPPSFKVPSPPPKA